MAISDADRDDMQAWILRGLGDAPHCAYLFLEVGDLDAARAWLAQVEVSSAAAGKLGEYRQIALSGEGLRALELPPELLLQFPEELMQGMSEPGRATLLGDVGDNAPDKWVVGGGSASAGAERVHVLDALFASSRTRLDELVGEERRRLAGAFTVVHEERAWPRDGDRREHFGFADGIAQPQIEGEEKSPTRRERPFPAGEFVLGHDNEYGRRPWSPSVPAHAAGARALDPSHPQSLVAEPGQTGLEVPRVEGPRRDVGRNGTYVVFRKLAQDVWSFWRWCEAQAAALGEVAHADPATWLAAKCMGRWPSGAPLVMTPHRDDGALRGEDDFLYDQDGDRHGHSCPIGSHIRRANPRDSKDRAGGNSISEVRLHRFVRRGRVYGRPLEEPRHAPKDDEDRGILFVAINANLRRQFEFVQQTWMANPRFGALDQDPDPVAGGGAPGDGVTLPAEPFARRAGGLGRFVTVRGGEYFFLPSRRALKFLARYGASVSSAETRGTRSAT